MQNHRAWTDAEIVNAAQKGGEFQRMAYEAYWPRREKYARFIARKFPDCLDNAMDIALDTMLKVFQRLSTTDFTLKNGIDNYTYTSLKNTALAYIEKGKCTGFHDELEPDLNTGQSENNGTTYSNPGNDKLDNINCMHAAFIELKNTHPRWARLLTAKILGYSASEVLEQENETSAGAIRTALAEAKKRYRKLLILHCGDNFFLQAHK